MALSNIIWIALGGALGAVLRAFVGYWLESDFPWATLTVNVVGSFTIGLVLSYDLNHSLNPGLKFFLAVGFCGALTTFSTFSYQTLSLLQRGQSVAALSNIALSLVLTIMAVGAGIKLSELLFGASAS